MNNIGDTNNTKSMLERLESLKAAIFASSCTILTFVITTQLKNYLLKRFSIFSFEQINIFTWHWWISAGVVLLSGFLFGVTYRYIIRSDNNLQLDAGGVMAFALVRGLAQADIKLALPNHINYILLLTIALAENIFLFGFAAFGLRIAIRTGWIKTFKSN
ncbi:MAG: hypothetical protein IGS39_20895 [Calothrix sp. C42_A2020_038]|nr:hypothetical protein [Calothrix sp. C42_A2020_038]